MHTILLVDDEESNLSTLSHTLSEYYEVLTAKDGQEALELIQNEENPDRIHLIISDQRMPQMTGVELLKETVRIIPKTIRIILTGFTDIDVIISSVNEGKIYNYLTKPIEKNDLLITVKRALQAYDLEHENVRLMDDLKVLNTSLEQKVEERTEELKKKNKVISEQNSQRQSLLHILCHDLANPIGSTISLNSVISEKGLLDEEGEMFLDLSMESLMQALEIIKLSQEMMALEEGKLDLTIEHISLLSLVNKSLEIVHSKFSTKNIKINRDVSSDIKVRVHPVSFVNSVLNNLLTNAAKFSENGSEVNISAKSENDFIKLCIQDFGVGMPQTLLEKVFDSTAKTSRPGTNGELGTGFGMPLVKKFIENYGGKIEMISNEKKEDDKNSGTIVTLFIPF